MCIVADASVLINFLRLDRMDLIGRHPGSFIVTNHVADEITDPEQKNRHESALLAGHLAKTSVHSSAELEIFNRLSQAMRLGAGESSAIAVALNRNCPVAIEDKKAINRTRGVFGKQLSVLRTQDIILDLIGCRVLSVEEADAILADWRHKRIFISRIQSFGELL